MTFIHENVILNCSDISRLGRYGEKFIMNDDSAAGSLAFLMGDGLAAEIIAYIATILIYFILYSFGEAVKNYSTGTAKEKVDDSVMKLHDDPQRLVDTIHLLATALLFYGGYYFSSHFMTMRYGILMTVGFIYLLLIFGILLPKRIASRYPVQVIRIFYGIVQVWLFLLTPFTWFLRKSLGFLELLFGIQRRSDATDVTEEEIIAIVNEGQEKGILQANEAEMINNIFELSDKQAQDIMTNRNNISGLDADIKVKDALWEILNNNYSRYPVYEENIDHIVGILHIKDLVRVQSENPKLNKTLKETVGLIRDAVFVPETRAVDALFEEMQATKTQMVIVVDEYGQTSGLVAMEDILEEIVGNIQDEYDADVHMIQKHEKEEIYKIDGLTRLEELTDTFGIDFGEQEFETINGYLVSLMEKIPEEDDLFETRIENYRFKVLEVENKVIKTIQVTPVLPEE